MAMEYKNILIVDDSATSRMIIKRCFEIAGFYESKFYEAEDAIKAVTFLEENEIDLILSDLNMPRMDGKTFIKKLRKKKDMQDIPVVVISSMGNDISISELLDGGVKAIIEKPLTPEKVAATFEEKL
jgi:two-component system, chemotaxis family, chemotaxis protein CheY